MCGINLIVDKKVFLDNGPIRRMNEATAHRGPDHQENIEIDFTLEKVFLGHNWLKIIGLGAQLQQPLISDCGRYYLLYNGEIYNFYELKNLLLSQHKNILFKTQTDTEVLLYYLMHYGKEGISHLNGMFSFVFIDKENESILLARDRFGMKPLFYSEGNNFFIASSETKGIIASGLVKKELNESQIPYYLRFRYANPPETFYKDIFSVMPGEVIERTTHSIIKYSYANNSKNIIPVTGLSDTEILNKTEEFLIDSLSRHLVADVPVGLWLSGGIDSTLLLALLQKAEIPSIPSFSMIYGKQEKSFGTHDYKYAKKAAAQYGSYHYSIEVNKNILSHFHDFINNLGQPVGDSAALLTYILSKETRKQVGVVLSGAGADEIFAGYNRHAAFYKYLSNPSFKKLIPYKKFFEVLLFTGINHPLRKYFQLIKKFIGNLDEAASKTFLNFTSLQNLRHCYSLEGNKGLLWGEKDLEGHFKQALKLDRENYLVNDVLAINDLMSMQHSLELRMPYLDLELISFINSLPAKKLIQNGRKWILSKILNDNKGIAYTKRKKEGFGLPFGQWIKDLNSPEIEYYFQNQSLILYEYFPYNSVQSLLNSHRMNKNDHTLELWNILVLAAWLEKEFK